MRFHDALYDGSDPLYAPLTSRSKKYVYWKPSARFVRMGASKKPVKLTGEVGDGQGEARAAEARKLTRELLAKFDETPDRQAGTWAWLIDTYLHGEYSPIHGVKPNTREGYQRQLSRWRKAIGHMKIGALDYTQIMKAKKAMEDNGHSAAAVRRMFVTLRIVANHGVALRAQGAAEVAGTLSNIRFPGSASRSVYPTRAEVMAIVDEADSRGLHAFALGILLQWWLGLRAVDVRGQWFEADDASGIIRKTWVKRRNKSYERVTRWQDGLTWDMIEPDLSGFRKVVSKTARSHPEPQFFDLTDLPEIQSRLRLLGHGDKSGPVILSSDGLPYTREGWTNAFRRIRKHLGLRQELRSMDIRAGAITEARDRGASIADMRDTAGHANAATTQRYIRGEDEARSRVVKLRRTEG
jgi:hypothetical protein